MKKITILFLSLFLTAITFSQNSEKAKSLLEEVSTKMGAYKNMYIGFNEVGFNKEAGEKESDITPIRGDINLAGEKYNLNYRGNKIIYNGSKLYIINHAEKEISILDEDLDDESGIIYPSKLLTFYKEGYNFEMGKLKNIKGRKIQFVTLNPIDSESEIEKVELAIDAKTKHIYKLIQTGKNGFKTIYTITKFKSNQNLSESFFSFNKEKYSKLEYRID